MKKEYRALSYVWVINPLFWVLILCSCSRESDIRYTEHPMTDALPYSDVEPDMLEILELAGLLNTVPENIQLLDEFLNHENTGLKKAELPILTTGNIDISSINDSTLLILEKNANQLIWYDLYQHDYEIIAAQGRGPGDLDFSTELAVYNNKAFVAMEGFQISVFTCIYAICEYENTIETKYNNYSISSEDISLFILGMSPFGYPQSPDSQNRKTHLVRKTDQTGQVQLSFMPQYNFQAPLVRSEIHSNGQLRSFSDINKTAITFGYLPYIYLHSFSGEFISKLKMPDFFQRILHYEEHPSGGGRSSWDYGNYSRFDHVSSDAKDGWLFIRVEEMRDVAFLGLDEGFEGTKWYSYYLLDVDRKEFYKIGDDEETHYSEGRKIYLIERGLIIHDEGTLFLVHKQDE